jgi:hypothetical protein
MGGSFWSRFVTRRRAAEERRETEDAGMSKAERRFTQETVEGHQADEFVESQLGGIDPQRLLDDGRPRHD